jgi:hypothetical protein
LSSSAGVASIASEPQGGERRRRGAIITWRWRLSRRRGNRKAARGAEEERSPPDACGRLRRRANREAARGAEEQRSSPDAGVRLYRLRTARQREASKKRDHHLALASLVSPWEPQGRETRPANSDHHLTLAPARRGNGSTDSCIQRYLRCVSEQISLLKPQRNSASAVSGHVPAGSSGA